jgi:hypothetical protein
MPRRARFSLHAHATRADAGRIGCRLGLRVGGGPRVGARQTARARTGERARMRLLVRRGSMTCGTRRRFDADAARSDTGWVLGGRAGVRAGRAIAAAAAREARDEDGRTRERTAKEGRRNRIHDDRAQVKDDGKRRTASAPPLFSRDLERCTRPSTSTRSRLAHLDPTGGANDGPRTRDRSSR